LLFGLAVLTGRKGRDALDLLRISEERHCLLAEHANSAVSRGRHNLPRLVTALEAQAI
jgi:hypothetical protein